jgi:ribosome-binding ATPase YchF (GTP1/OBG family)
MYYFLFMQSTFYNAVTRAILDSRGGRKVAEVAAHPFTTIEPNVGPGWYLSSQEDLPPSHSQESVIVDRSSAYGRVHGRRLLPVVVKDVAGLVPGAYQGRGKGNKFLGDLCDADVLVHVVSVDV